MDVQICKAELSQKQDLKKKKKKILKMHIWEQYQPGQAVFIYYMIVY